MSAIEKLRSCLASQVAPPLVVTARRTQYSASEDSEFFTDIDVQSGPDQFLLAVVYAGDERRNEFFLRVLHYYTPEVWLIDANAGRMIVSHRDAEPVVLSRGVLTPAFVPGVEIPLADIFG